MKEVIAFLKRYSDTKALSQCLWKPEQHIQKKQFLPRCLVMFPFGSR